MTHLILPCGAGSLTSGAAFAMHQLDPSVHVVAVEPAAVPRFTESIKAGKPVTVEMGQTIGEAPIRQAVKEMALRAKVCAEPSACVGIAAALGGQIDTSRGKKLCFVISGGNLDAALLSQILTE